MGSKSSSKTSSSTSTNSANLNFQNVDGPAFGEAGGDVVVISSDQGAIQAGKEIALESIREGASGLEELSMLTGDVLDSGGRIVDRSLDVVENFIQEQSDLTRDLVRDSQAAQAQQAAAVFAANAAANDRVEAISYSAINASDRARQSVEFLARDFIDEGNEIIGEVIATTQNNQQDFVRSISEIQARESTNNDARIVEIVKFVMIGVAVVGGALVFKGK